MNNDYYPDNWIILKITNPDTKEIHYRVLAGWSGGYLDGDSWRMNSGIVRCEDAEDYYRFYGESGSCYVCHKNAYRTSMATGPTLTRFKNTGAAEDLPDCNWVEFDYAR